MKSSSLFKACQVFFSTESFIPIEIAYKGKNGEEYPSKTIIAGEKAYSIENPDNYSDGTRLIENFLIAPGGCLELDYLW